MSLQKIVDTIKTDKPVKWLFYGDSITHGLINTFGSRDYAELFDERIRGELGRTSDVVINTAISGNTTEDLLESFDWRVEQFTPDVVFLMIGMNDCSNDKDVSVEQFYNNLKELLQRFEAMNSNVVLQTTCPVLPGSAPEREGFFSAYMDKIREVAKEKATPLIDHTKYWQDNIEKHYHWMANSIHPNQYGHRVFAKLIFEELAIFDADSSVCQLFIP